MEDFSFLQEVPCQHIAEINLNHLELRMSSQTSRYNTSNLPSTSEIDTNKHLKTCQAHMSCQYLQVQADSRGSPLTNPKYHNRLLGEVPAVDNRTPKKCVD